MKNRAASVWTLVQWLLILAAYVAAVAARPEDLGLFQLLVSSVMTLNTAMAASALLSAKK